MHPSPEQIVRFRGLWQTLTEQERRSLLARCAGQTNGEVAEARFITVATVKVHLTTALRKLRGVVSTDKPNNRGVLEVVCWHLGYEAARQNQDQPRG